MNELEQAERALLEAREKASGLAAMGSLELRTAVEGGPSHAQQLFDYHTRMFDESRNTVAWYMRVCDLREAQSLPSIEPQFEITPDYGPTPTPEPGTNTLTGKAHLWTLLLGSLNGRDLDQIARCLRETGGLDARHGGIALGAEGQHKYSGKYSNPTDRHWPHTTETDF